MQSTVPVHFWYWHNDSNGWDPYDALTAGQLEQLYQSQVATAPISEGKYIVNFQNFTQQNSKTKFSRKILRATWFWAGDDGHKYEPYTHDVAQILESAFQEGRFAPERVKVDSERFALLQPDGSNMRQYRFNAPTGNFRYVRRGHDGQVVQYVAPGLAPPSRPVALSGVVVQPTVGFTGPMVSGMPVGQPVGISQPALGVPMGVPMPGGSSPVGSGPPVGTPLPTPPGYNPYLPYQPGTPAPGTPLPTPGGPPVGTPLPNPNGPNPYYPSYPGYPPSNTPPNTNPGYPPSPGYPTPNTNYPPGPGTGYPPTATGYPPQNPTGYPGYPPQNPAGTYSPQNSTPGYPPQNPAYPPANTGTPGGYPGYPPQNQPNTGYPPQNTGYPPNTGAPGYPPAPGGYQPPANLTGSYEGTVQPPSNLTTSGSNPYEGRY